MSEDVLRYRGTVRIISDTRALLNALGAEATRIQEQIEQEELQAKAILERSRMPALMVLTRRSAALLEERAGVVAKMRALIELSPEQAQTDETWTG